MVQTEKVSVIVPIYKVEKYIHRCINSIMKQTYQNLQVILVNDGSPDRCGEIAEQYAAVDDRVKVIHKENGGLSDARNYGMKYVTGMYTMFVDSDDWIDVNMIEKMVNKSHEYEADVVQSAFYYAYDDQLFIDNRHHDINDDPVMMDNKTLMYELVKNEKVKNFAWGKLYKTELIRDIPFKKGVLFEDVFWAHQVMHRVSTYLMLHQPMYYYYQRDDSIVATYSPRNLDIIEGLKERHQFIQKNYPQYIKFSNKRILDTCLIHHNLLLRNTKKQGYTIHRKKLQTYIYQNYNQFLESVEHDKHLKWQLRLFQVHPIIQVIYLGIRKCLTKVNLKSQPVGLKRIS